MKFVLIGAGQRGMIYAKYAVEKGHAIAAVAETDETKRRIAGENFGIPESFRFRNGKELLEQQKLGDAAIIATGAAVRRALDAEKLLAEMGFKVKVIEMPCIKPLDNEAVLEAAKTGFVITAEDHNIIGGLGSAVAEVLAENGCAKLLRIGIEDEYCQSGEHEELLDIYNLRPSDMAEKISKFISASEETT